MSPGNEFGPGVGSGTEEAQQADASKTIVSRAADNARTALHPTRPTAANTEPVTAQLDRRRDAAARSVPSENGVRDPWVEPRGRSQAIENEDGVPATGFRVVVVNTGRSASVHLRAPRQIAAVAAADLGLEAPEFCGAGWGYPFPRRLFPDLVAVLEWRGMRVRLTQKRRRDLAAGDPQ